MTTTHDRSAVLAPHAVPPKNRVYTKTAAEVALRALDFEERVSSGATVALTWGIDEVDAVVRTMWPGNLTYLVGRPSNGKSMALVHLARRECQRLAYAQASEREAGIEGGPASKRYVMFTSLEDPEQTVHAYLTGAPATLTDVMDRKHDRAAYRRHMTRSAVGWPIWYQGFDQSDVTTGIVEDLPNLTVEQAYREIRQVEADHGIRPSAWFVDYLQLFASELVERSESEERVRIANVSRQLKRIARILDIPVICAAQAKQTVDQRQLPTPSGGDIEGSNQGLKDADVVLSVWMPRMGPSDKWEDGIDVGGTLYPGHAITPGFTFLSLVKQRGYIGFGRWAVDADLETKTYRAARLGGFGA
jgi:replicative DNA helicase